MPPFLAKEPLEGTPNALLIARYCKLFGIAPADEFGIIDPMMRMAVNYGCYISHQYAENLEYEKAQKTKENEAFAMNEHLKMLKELEEKATSRGG